MSYCSDCEKQKRIIYNEQLNKAREEAQRIGKAKGLSAVYIVETINGIPACREPGDESLARLRIIDTVFI